MRVIHLTNETFEKEVLHSPVPVLVDFWAEWCGPCKMLAPTVDALAEELDNVKVCKVNVDDCMDLAQVYGIQSIPSLLVFENGQVVNQGIGFMPKDAVLALLPGQG